MERDLYHPEMRHSIEWFASSEARGMIVFCKVTYNDRISSNSNREGPVPGSLLEKLFGKPERLIRDESQLRQILLKTLLNTETKLTTHQPVGNGNLIFACV